MGSIVYVYYVYTCMYVYSVSGAIFAQAALSGKIINHSVCSEQVGVTGNIIIQDFSCFLVSEPFCRVNLIH